MVAYGRKEIRVRSCQFDDAESRSMVEGRDNNMADACLACSVEDGLAVSVEDLQVEVAMSISERRQQNRRSAGIYQVGLAESGDLKAVLEN